MTLPQGPVYVSLDAALQEEALAAPRAAARARPLSAPRRRAPPPEAPCAKSREPARKRQASAAHDRPRVERSRRISRGASRWPSASARSCSPTSRPAPSFPTQHPLHPFPPSLYVDGRRGALDPRRRRDPEPRLDRSRRHAAPGLRRRAAARPRSSSARSISTSTTARTWITRRCRRPICRSSRAPDALVAALVAALGPRAATPTRSWFVKPRRAKPRRRPSAAQRRPRDRMPLADLARVTTETLAPHRPSYIRLPLGWPGESCRFTHPHDYIGFDGGGGIGSGPGMAVGAALALRGGDRLPVAVLGDGDYLMGADRAVDRRPLSRAGADHRRQQRIVLQRRAAPGAHGARCAAGRSRIAGSACA